MRKISTILLICLCVSLGVTAQKKGAKYKVGFGIKTGINITHLNLNGLNDSPDPRLQSNDWRTGFVLGAFLNAPVYKHFSIQPEFLYSSMGGDYTTTLGDHIRDRYNYFSIPVMAKYSFCKNWAALVGPQFDMLIEGKETTSTGRYKVSDNLKDFDVLVTGGIEYQASKTIVLQARYMRGFNDVDFRADMRRYFNEGVQVTFGVKL